LRLKLGSKENVWVPKWVCHEGTPQAKWRWEMGKLYLGQALKLIKACDRKQICETVVLSKGGGPQQTVATSEQDIIIYAQRHKKKSLSRFVKGRKEELSTSMTLILTRMPSTETVQYALLSQYFGEHLPAEPWEKLATEEGKEFWKHNAFIYNSEWIVPGTEIDEEEWLSLQNPNL
jgi:hypothetical protein